MWKTLWTMWKKPLPQGKGLWKVWWEKWIKNCIEGDKIIFGSGEYTEYYGR